jgi:hypothetical protein
MAERSFTMKAFAAVSALILLTVSLVSAQTYASYSVTELMGINGKTNQYGAVVSVASKPTTADVPSNGSFVTITTSNCDHVTKAPETGIVVSGPSGKSLLFSSGASCAIVSVAVK